MLPIYMHEDSHSDSHCDCRIILTLVTQLSAQALGTCNSNHNSHPTLIELFLTPLNGVCDVKQQAERCCAAAHGAACEWSMLLLIHAVRSHCSCSRGGISITSRRGGTNVQVATSSLIPLNGFE